MNLFSLDMIMTLSIKMFTAYINLFDSLVVLHVPVHVYIKYIVVSDRVCFHAVNLCKVQNIIMENIFLVQLFKRISF